MVNLRDNNGIRFFNITVVVIFLIHILFSSVLFGMKISLLGNMLLASYFLPFFFQGVSFRKQYNTVVILLLLNLVHAFLRTPFYIQLLSHIIASTLITYKFVSTIDRTGLLKRRKEYIDSRRIYIFAILSFGMFLILKFYFPHNVEGSHIPPYWTADGLKHMAYINTMGQQGANLLNPYSAGDYTDYYVLSYIPVSFLAHFAPDRIMSVTFFAQYTINLIILSLLITKFSHFKWLPLLLSGFCLSGFAVPFIDWYENIERINVTRFIWDGWSRELNFIFFFRSYFYLFSHMFALSLIIPIIEKKQVVRSTLFLLIPALFFTSTPMIAFIIPLIFSSMSKNVRIVVIGLLIIGAVVQYSSILNNRLGFFPYFDPIPSLPILFPIGLLFYSYKYDKGNHLLQISLFLFVTYLLAYIFLDEHAAIDVKLKLSMALTVSVFLLIRELKINKFAMIFLFFNAFMMLLHEFDWLNMYKKYNTSLSIPLPNVSEINLYSWIIKNTPPNSRFIEFPDRHVFRGGNDSKLPVWTGRSVVISDRGGFDIKSEELEKIFEFYELGKNTFLLKEIEWDYLVIHRKYVDALDALKDYQVSYNNSEWVVVCNKRKIVCRSF